MMKFKKYILLILIFFVTSCATKSEGPRPPAVARTYTYRQLPMCANLQSGPPLQTSEVWTCMQGLPVGPTSRSHFKNLNNKILRPFTSDGCSLSPNAVPFTKPEKAWAECCVAHDASYWLGGTIQEKITADADLKQCIANKGYPNIGRVYEFFVHRFGTPNSTDTFRWGYGWNAQRDYAPLTLEEKDQVRRLYNIKANDIKDYLTANTTELVAVCDTYDSALHTHTVEEKFIFNFLNDHLKTDTFIDTAKRVFFNSDKKIFEVKLQGCEKTVTFSIDQTLQGTFEFRNQCPQLF